MHGLLGSRRLLPAARPLGRKRYLLFALFCWALWPVSSLAQDPAITLTDIGFSALPGDRVLITLTMSGPVTEPGLFSTDQPARIALDFPGTKSGLPKKSRSIGIGMAHSVKAIEAMGRTRVVINLVSLVPFDVEVEANRVMVTLESAGAAKQAKKQAPPAQVLSGVRRELTHIDFRRGPNGEGRVLVTLSDPSILVDSREEGGQVILDFLDSGVPEHLVRRLDVTDFATPVASVDTYPMGGDVHMAIAPLGEYDYLSYQTGELFTIEFKPLTKEQKDDAKKRRLQYTGERLSLNFQDIEVRAVLQLLADFTDINFVTSDTVTGSLTLRLRNVPWDQALDIILKTKGLSMRQTGNVILVAPTEEIAAREQLELESRNKIAELAPLRSEFIQANYAKAGDLAALLKSKENSLLSERGNVTVDERTNTLLIQDTVAKLEDIRRLIVKLDVPVRQVLIESRVVIANDDFSRDLGVRFGFTGFGERGGLGYSTGQDNIVEGPDGTSPPDLIVDLPAGEPSGAINFLIGRIGDHLLRLELSAMQNEGRGEIVASPRVITSDKQEAIIKTGKEVPYTTVSQEGTQTEFKEAVLELKVTPHITPDDRILMDLAIKKDEPDFSREVQGVPPLDKREINTKVLVDNGETVVLGGVFEQTNTSATEKVPFFGDLPYVGALFRQQQTQNQKQELLVFVTPKVLKSALSLR